MKKRIIALIVVSIFFIVLFLCLTFLRHIIYIDGKWEKIYFPDMGFVPNKESAIRICRIYFENVGLDTSDMELSVKYEANLDAWIIVQEDEKNESDLTLDGGLKMVIKREDGKVLK